ncbi:polysaccharide deacetylase family protein [Kitasatospora mediocidica]|uniref:lipoprotein n=1 Tax=Kitasatospora mediocidica TaxID=58352 RepID=UPI0005647BFC|nr:lipoprotein [Kitasatospora mediocidica]
MSHISRRTVLSATAATAALGAVAACGSATSTAGSGSDARTPAGNGTTGSPAGQPSAKATLIGDGSTSDTGAQPNQPKPEKLKPGEQPPQFVVFSWDGAGATDDNQFPRFLKLAEQYKATMTFFLSGIYTLPKTKTDLYHPPQHSVGASDIPYLSDGAIRNTIKLVSQAWLAGHEIGTHFNGHFCSSRPGGNGVNKWSSDDWQSEIDQAISFVTNWKTNTGFTDLPALPFDYKKELIGGRTPCLEGQKALLPTAAKMGWKYDASSPGGLQIWPQKVQNDQIWDFPLQSIPFPGHTFQVLSMDYNILANQSAGSTKGDPGKYDTWRSEAAAAYQAGFDRAYTTNRAPFFVGNHFEQWNGGIYMDAVEATLKYVAGKPDVRLVSFRQLVEWMEVQDQSTLRKLRSLNVGQAPAGGWGNFLGAAGASGTPTS